MKKIYFVDEEEKLRILSIHESEAKRKFLSEDETSPFGGTSSMDDLNPLSAKNLIPGLKREDNWETIYSCVPSQGKKPKKLSDGSTAYVINGYVYYNNGFKRKYPAKDNKSEKYSCATEKFDVVSSANGTTTDDKAKKGQQYKQQIVTNTSNTTKKIQELLGLKQTGIMDSLLLQKINEKLNGTVQQTPATNASSVPSENTQPEVKSVTKSLPPVNPSNTAAQIQSMVKDFSPTQAKTAPSREEAIANAKAALERARKLK